MTFLCFEHLITFKIAQAQTLLNVDFFLNSNYFSKTLKDIPYQPILDSFLTEHKIINQLPFHSSKNNTHVQLCSIARTALYNMTIRILESNPDITYSLSTSLLNMDQNLVLPIKYNPESKNLPLNFFLHLNLSKPELLEYKRGLLESQTIVSYSLSTLQEMKSYTEFNQIFKNTNNIDYLTYLKNSNYFQSILYFEKIYENSNNQAILLILNRLYENLLYHLALVGEIVKNFDNFKNLNYPMVTPNDEWTLYHFKEMNNITAPRGLFTDLCISTFYELEGKLFTHPDFINRVEMMKDSLNNIIADQRKASASANTTNIVENKIKIRQTKEVLDIIKSVNKINCCLPIEIEQTMFPGSNSNDMNQYIYNNLTMQKNEIIVRLEASLKDLASKFNHVANANDEYLKTLDQLELEKKTEIDNINKEFNTEINKIKKKENIDKILIQQGNLNLNDKQEQLNILKENLVKEVNILENKRLIDIDNIKEKYDIKFNDLKNDQISYAKLEKYYAEMIQENIELRNLFEIVKQKDIEICKLTEENTILKNIFQKFQQQLNVEINIDNLLDKNIETIDNEIKTLLKDNKTLETGLQKQDAEIEELREQNYSLFKEVEELTREQSSKHKVLLKENEILKDTLKLISEKNESGKNTEILRLVEENLKLNEFQIMSQNKFDSLNDMISDLQIKMEDLREIVRDQRIQIFVFEQNENSRNVEMSELMNECDRVANIAEKLNNENIKLKQVILDLTTKHDSVPELINETERLSDLNINLDNKVKDLVRYILKLENEAAEFKEKLLNENDILVQEKTQLITENDKLAQEKIELINKNSELAQEKIELINKNSELIKKTNILNHANNQMMMNNRQLIIDKKPLNEMIQKLNVDKQELSYKIEKLENENGPLTDTVETLKKINKNLNKEVKNFLKMNTMLIDSNLTIMNENNQLTEAFNIVQNQNDRIKNYNDILIRFIDLGGNNKFPNVNINSYVELQNFFALNEEMINTLERQREIDEQLRLEFADYLLIEHPNYVTFKKVFPICVSTAAIIGSVALAICF